MEFPSTLANIPARVLEGTDLVVDTPEMKIWKGFREDESIIRGHGMIYTLRLGDKVVKAGRTVRVYFSTVPTCAHTHCLTNHLW